jgi:hypothetical protein
MAADIVTKSGDRLPVFAATVLDADNNPVDCTGASGVRFKMRPLRGTDLLIDAAGSFTNITQGGVEYVPTGTAPAGGYTGEFTVTFPEGKETFPNSVYISIAVLPSLGDVPDDTGPGPLVSPAAFAEFRQIPYDPSDVYALRALEDSSDLVRALCRQTLSLVSDDQVELEGNWTHRMWLPERPVRAVSDVKIVFDYGYTQDIPVTAYRFNHQGRLKLFGWYWGGEDATVLLKYTHGYDPVPGDLGAVVMKLALRALVNPANVIAETVGAHSVQYAATTLPRVGGGQTGLSAEEHSVIRRYRGLARS